MQFQGAFTALVTPFRNGAVDEERYRALIEWQIEQGINGLVPCGTTGESATLTHQEHKDVIRICVEQVKGRVPVLAGAGSNNTREAVELTRYARQAGADGALLITPYYNKPTQEGEIIEYCGADFQVLSGDDFTVLPLLAVGGCGVISVSSNVVPAKMSELCRAFFEGDLATARRVHYEIASINRAMFLETNPIPVKTALSMMGRIELELRLPMVPLQPANQSRLRDILSAAGIV